MADGTLPLNQVVVPGQIEDVEQLNIVPPAPPAPAPGFIAVVRQRIQMVGRLYQQIAEVLDTNPANGDFGLVTRDIPFRTTASVVTSVPASVVIVTLLAANPARKQALFQVPGLLTGGTLSLLFGGSLLATVDLVPGAYYELPQPVYAGIIEGVWSAAIGSVIVTELT